MPETSKPGTPFKRFHSSPEVIRPVVMMRSLKASLICSSAIGSASEEARQDVFDYIEMFYNPVRKHAKNGMLSPVNFERQQNTNNEGV